MQLTYVQEEILGIIRRAGASYANPLSSDKISRNLNVTPSYVREQSRILVAEGFIQVRRGPGGGYFVSRAREG